MRIMANTGNIDTAVNTVSTGVTSILSTGAGLISWGQGMFGKYAMWIFGLIGLMFLSRMLKIKV